MQGWCCVQCQRREDELLEGGGVRDVYIEDSCYFLKVACRKLEWRGGIILMLNVDLIWLPSCSLTPVVLSKLFLMCGTTSCELIST